MISTLSEHVKFTDHHVNSILPFIYLLSQQLLFLPGVYLFLKCSRRLLQRIFTKFLACSKCVLVCFKFQANLPCLTISFLEYLIVFLYSLFWVKWIVTVTNFHYKMMTICKLSQKMGTVLRMTWDNITI